MACVCDHDYPRRPCYCTDPCGRPCPTPQRMKALEAENRRLRAMLLHIHSVVDGGWPRLDTPTREYWLRQVNNPEWAEWFGNQEP